MFYFQSPLQRGSDPADVQSVLHQLSLREPEEGKSLISI